MIICRIIFWLFARYFSLFEDYLSVIWDNLGLKKAFFKEQLIMCFKLSITIIVVSSKLYRLTCTSSSIEEREK